MEFLYPLALNKTGDIALAGDDEQVPLQSIRQILDVEPGEVIFEPDYGSDKGLFEGGIADYSPLKSAIDRWLESNYWAMTVPTYSENASRTDEISYGSNFERITADFIQTLAIKRLN